MPELPEVETVRGIIEPQIRGRCIQSVSVTQPRVIAWPDACRFAEALSGQTIASMSRRGKFLTIHLVSGDRVVLHLRMTGQLLAAPPEYPVEKHTHLIAELSGGMQLRYVDVRRFGRFWLLRAGESDSVTGQDRLGPEPMDDGLTAAYLKEKLGTRGKTIKEMLHDQSIVAGIGNIYSDEILFAAGICPEERCRQLTDADWERLAEKIPEIILWGIAADRMSPEEYLAGAGREYRNIPELKVYGRSGQPCTRCGTPLERIVIGGRSSCFCPGCQRKRT